MKTIQYLIILMGFLLPVILQADIIELENGLRVKGRIIDESDTKIRLKRIADEVSVHKNNIKKIIRSYWDIKLGHGIRLSGMIIRETDEIIELRTSLNNNTITVKKDEIESVQEKGIPLNALSKRKRIHPEHLFFLRTEAVDHLKNERLERALTVYTSILRSYPEDTNALYNVACVFAKMNRPKKSLEFLKNAVDWGFSDFKHIGSDPDLELIRNMDGYKKLLEHKNEFVRVNQEGTVSIISEDLLRKGVWVGNYTVVCNPEKMLTFVYSMPEEEFLKIRRQLQNFAEALWNDLFFSKPGSPIYVVLLSRRDTPKVLKGIGGLYNPGTNILYCGSSGVNSLLNSNVILHEFTHALHWGDANARGQVHPMWLQEGLASLYESSELKDGTQRPVHSYRLGVVQKALSSGKVIAWEAFMSLDYMTFMKNATLAYAQARYMLFYIAEKGLLKKFYNEYTRLGQYNSPVAVDQVFRSVFGKPIPSVQRDWEKWIREKSVPELPFMGIKPKLGPVHVQIGAVLKDSPADKAGIQIGDIIQLVNDTAVGNWDDLLQVLSTVKPGDSIRIKLKRFKNELTLSLTLGEMSKGLNSVKSSEF